MLDKNVVVVRYLRIGVKNGKVDYIDSDKLLSKQSYHFYVDGWRKKALSIGSIIAYRSPKYHEHKHHYESYAVIVDNLDEPNAMQEHKRIQWLYNKGHLRTFLTKIYHIQRGTEWSNAFYKAFRDASTNYRNRQK